MYPSLPKPNVEELGEIRTIGQVVEYLQKLAGGEKKKPSELGGASSGALPISQPVEESSFEELLPANVNLKVKRHPVQLKSLPTPPDYLEFTLPEGHICLITDDGSLTTSKLAHSLTDKGWKVVVLNFPSSAVSQTSPLPSGVNRVKLENFSEEHLQQQLSAIATNYGSVGAFIHLHPLFETTDAGVIPFLEAEKAIVKHVFLMAKHLKKSLNEAANYGRSCFIPVVRLDGAFGLEHHIKYSVIGAGLFGLSKSLNWEWQKVFCRAIDISPLIDPEESAKHIIAELHDHNLYTTEVAYGSQGRVTIV
jgi:hypothetical protein